MILGKSAEEARPVCRSDPTFCSPYHNLMHLMTWLQKRNFLIGIGIRTAPRSERGEHFNRKEEKKVYLV